MEPARTEQSTNLTPIRFVFSDCLISLSSLSSHPLFSVFVAAAILAALFVPTTLLPLLLSPVAFSAILLLLALLLRLAIADELTLPPPDEPNTQEIDRNHQKAIFCDAYVDWRRWPLEVIYEEYEGEEEEESGGRHSLEYFRWSPDADTGGGCGASSDSDSQSSGSSGSPMAAGRLAEPWDSQEKMSFWWTEDMEVSEGEEDELIEIPLEEDNLIEIDIFGGR